MATPQVVLTIIATTLVSVTLFVWATIHYVPLILCGDDHADDSHADAGQAS